MACGPIEVVRQNVGQVVGPEAINQSIGHAQVVRWASTRDYFPKVDQRGGAAAAKGCVNGISRPVSSLQVGCRGDGGRLAMRAGHTAAAVRSDQPRAGSVGRDAAGGRRAAVERCFEPVAVRLQGDATGANVGRPVAACERGPPTLGRGAQQSGIGPSGAVLLPPLLRLRTGCRGPRSVRLRRYSRGGRRKRPTGPLPRAGRYPRGGQRLTPVRAWGSQAEGVLCVCELCAPRCLLHARLLPCGPCRAEEAPPQAAGPEAVQVGQAARWVGVWPPQRAGPVGSGYSYAFCKLAGLLGL